MAPIRTASSRPRATRRAPQRTTSRPRNTRGVKRFCVVFGGLVCVIGACAAFSAPFKLYDVTETAPQETLRTLRPLFSRGDDDPYYASVKHDCLTGAGIVVDPCAPASTLNIFADDDSATERVDAFEKSLADNFETDSAVFFANTGATIIPDGQGAQFADLPLPDPTVALAEDHAVDFGSEVNLPASWWEEFDFAETKTVDVAEPNDEIQVASQQLDSGRTSASPTHESRVIALTSEQTSQPVRLARAEEERDMRVQPLSDVPIPREPQTQTRVSQAGVILAPSGYRRAGSTSGASPTGAGSIGEARLVF